MQKINLSNYKIFIGDDSLQELKQYLDQTKYSKVFVLVDENTEKHCLPIILPFLPEITVISIPSGEQNKTIDACSTIWQALTEQQADRHAVLINLGGGLIGDVGGFAAACYKRGIRFIQVPTTLLAMADASVGGKTGVNFGNFKNQVGAFSDPASVFMYPHFLRTLPERELKSGFAEIIKHYLIADAAAFREWAANPKLPQPHEYEKELKRSIVIKAAIVTRDPHEQGERKALNFGHTIGHAIESYFMDRGADAWLHGEAVAAGMIAEAELSEQKGLLTREELELIKSSIGNFYRLPEIGEQEWQEINRLMYQDKKNSDGRVRFTLLDGIGKVKINC